MSRRRIAGAGIALATLVAAGPVLARDGGDSLAFTSFTLRSPAGGLSIGARGQGRAMTVGPLAVRWVSEAAAHRAFAGARGHVIAGGIRAELQRLRAAWVGLGVRRGSILEPEASSPAFEIGARTQLARAVLQVHALHRWVDVPRPPVLIMTWRSPPHFQSPPGIIPRVPYWEARAPVRKAITSFDALLEWGRAGWDLETRAGLTFARDLVPIRMARLEVTRWIRPRWGVVMGVAGAAPRWLTDDVAEGPSAWLGLRTELGPERASWIARSGPPRWRWRVLALDDGVWSFRLGGGAAGRVALRGDFTRWEAVGLHRTRDGGWETSLRVTPGVHQIEISIDGGAWQPPPGAPTMAGTYGGEVGIFVAE